MKRQKAPTKTKSPTKQPVKKKPAVHSRTDPPAKTQAALASGVEPRDPSDLARDQRLRDEMQHDSARSPLDRHRERLTATEAEEDGVREDDDDERDETEKREQALTEQEVDDERS